MFKKKTIKAMVNILALSMILGLVQGITVNTNVKADEMPVDKKPSISAFADTAALSGSTFNPSGTGSSSDVLASIRFGKDNAKWYILGGDSGVSSPNMAVFAVSNFIDLQQFLAEGNYCYEDSIYKYTGEFDSSLDGSYEGGDPSTILANHYGVSELRDKLDDIANSSLYFSSSEMALLNETKINTIDYYNNKSYSTIDKLYAAGTDEADNTYIYVGSDNSKKLTSNYWSSGNSFWLRTPQSSDSENAFVTSSGESSIMGKEARLEYGIRPAANINLTNVLFASAALPAASSEAATKGEIAKGTAMSLRLDGSGQNIGSVTYSGYTITANATRSDAVLVVQGKDTTQNPNKDWYYSKPITGTENITDEEILKVLNNSDTGSLNVSGVNLPDCKIWLEISAGNDSTLAYAIEAKEEAVHVHNYDDTWTADKTYHWKQCTPANACPSLKESIKDKAAHTYGLDEDKASWKYNSNEHYKFCTTCDDEKSMTGNAAHEFGTDEKCVVCGYSLDEEHKLEEVPAKDPTCTEKGNEKYWYCTDERCDVKYKLSDKEVCGVQTLEEFTDMSEVEKKPLGHLESTSFEHNEKEHWHVCTRTGCGIKLSIADHSFNDKNVCTACGYAKPDEGGDGDDKGDKGDEDDDDDKGDKDDKDHDDKPDDGDSTIVRTEGSSNINTGWVKDNKGWRFKNSDGTYAKGTAITDANGKRVESLLWQRVGSCYYAFGTDAYLVTCWIYDELSSKWYYCDENAGMLHGWFYDTKYGSWYYLDLSTGAMYADTITPDNYNVDKSGALIN